MKPTFMEIEATHDCFLVDTTGRMDSRVTVVNVRCLPQRMVCTAEVNSPELDSYLDAIGRHPQVKRLTQVFKEKDRALVQFMIDDAGTLHKAVFDSGCVLAEPTLSTNGTDLVTVIAPAHTNIKQLFGNFDDSYDARIVRKKRVAPKDIKSLNFFTTTGFLELQSMQQLLTPRQREVLELACKRGYYKFPKRVTLGGMSQELGLKESTVREHLRKAEQRVMPIFTDILNKL